MSDETRQYLHVLTEWRTEYQKTSAEEIDMPALLEVFSSNKLLNNVQIHPQNPNVMGLRDSTKDCWIQLSKHLSKEIESLYYLAATTHPGGSDVYSPTLSNRSDSTENSKKEYNENNKIDFYDRWDNFHGQIYQVTWDLWDTMPHCEDEEDDPKEFFEYKKRFMIAILGNMRTKMIQCYETPYAVIVDLGKLTHIQRVFEKYFIGMWDKYWEDTYVFRRGLRFGVGEGPGKEIEWVIPGDEVNEHCWKVLEICQLACLHYDLVCHFDICKLPAENKWDLLNTWRDSLFKELTPFIHEVHGESWARFPYQLYNHCTHMAANAALQNIMEERENDMDGFKKCWIDLFYATMEDVWDDWKARLEAEKTAAEKKEAEQELTSKQKKNRLKSHRDKVKAKAKKAAMLGASRGADQEGEVEEDEKFGGGQKAEKKEDANGSEDEGISLKDQTNKAAQDENGGSGQKAEKKKKKKGGKKENGKNESNQLGMDNDGEGFGSDDTSNPESKRKAIHHLGFMTDIGIKGLGINLE